ncbi:MAG: hypothetical protein IJR54_03415 [Oscillibacter sp.]|nr:hypothetical protein [Oscillibacter sp.]
MNEIRRKLRARNGVTVVFALVVFLIMALFSYVMVNASLTAAQGVRASQVDEQAYLSVRPAATMIRKAVTDSQITFQVNPTGSISWNSGNDIIRKILLDSLNQPEQSFTWKVKGTTSDNDLNKAIEETFGEVKFTVTAKKTVPLTYTYPGTDPPVSISLQAPVFTVRFKSGYNMIMTITPQTNITPTASPDVYNVPFDVQTSLGG